ncbi:hypothetical protein Tco_0909344 [Tanacetum coccineum]|uniref:Reverse transcriptase domain-containing protein n=1 Tax=Tanacetum coccineum TaxID=301880 RepID=A0ABQ5CW13_9ASTR
MDSESKLSARKSSDILFRSPLLHIFIAENPLSAVAVETGSEIVLSLDLVQLKTYWPSPVSNLQIHHLPITLFVLTSWRHLWDPSAIAFPKILTMSTNEQTPLSQPTSIVRNTLGKEQVLQDQGMPIFDKAQREYCKKNYHQILPIIAKKVHQEKVQEEKIKAEKARLNFKETSQHSESRTLNRRRDLKERLGPRHARSMSRSPESRRGSAGDKEKSVSAHSRGSSHQSHHRDTESCYQSSRSRETKFASEKHHNKRASSRRTEALSESKVAQDDIGSQNQRSKSQALRTTCPNYGEDPEDHLKIFQATAKTERWAMPTWYHMFNSTLTGNARQKKYIKHPVEIHNIKQRDRESTKEFVRRYKLECRDVKGALECIKIAGFMHEITNPELIKRLHDKIPNLVDEMMRITTTFLRGEVAASNRERKKSFPSWKQQEAGHKQNFKKGGFRNQQRTERKQDRFTLLTKTPKEIPALDKGKFKPPPPMTTPVEKRNASKFCEFHGEVGHTTDECMHLKRQIEEMLKAEKLSNYVVNKICKLVVPVWKRINRIANSIKTELQVLVAA